MYQALEMHYRLCRQRCSESLCPAMINPTVAFNNSMDGKPLGHITFELFADKVPKTVEHSVLSALGRKDLITKVPASTENSDLCAR